MIYDCFTFFNEFDLLEIRLNELTDYVDKFVICESRHTFSGKPKPLYFKDNIDRFEKFKDKIIHIESTKFSNVAWENEYNQRNDIKYAFKDLKDSDIIILSDCDEIPRLNLVDFTKIQDSLIYNLSQNLYFYYMNYKCTNISWSGSQVFTLKTFKESNNELDEIRKENLPTKFSKRCNVKRMSVENGGWHFSYLGGVESILTKVTSFAHCDYLQHTPLNSDVINKKLENKSWLWNDGQRVDLIQLDNYDYLPKYVLNNIEKFSHLIRT
jgi:beta-1,4-mannosyl-glycoprotein beta-1,4-N-acetylglucosaminyltransferase